MNSHTKIRFVGLVGLGSIAVWLTLSLGTYFYFSVASLRWPKVPVRIIASSVNTGTSNLGNWWVPDVQYEYQLDGRAYRSTKVRYLMPVFHQEEDARSIQVAYPQGAAAAAVYDPRNPARSVLESGIPPGMWERALSPLFFWALTLYLFYEFKRPERSFLMRPAPEAAEE